MTMIAIRVIDLQDAGYNPDTNVHFSDLSESKLASLVVECEGLLERLVEAEYKASKKEVNEVFDSYVDGLCPDCSEDIPEDVVEGQACSNCEHVFYKTRCLWCNEPFTEGFQGHCSKAHWHASEACQ